MTEPASATDLTLTRRRLAQYDYWLESAFPIPGTKWRVGLDPLIGLVPGLGDIVGLALGAALVYEAVRVSAPRELVARMLANVGVDALIGIVPVVGDVFDFAFKANRRNARLLTAHLDARDRDIALQD